MQILVLQGKSILYPGIPHAKSHNRRFETHETNYKAGIIMS